MRMTLKALLLIALLAGPVGAVEYDVYFPNEPNAAGKAIMIHCGEHLRGAGGGTYWHCLVTAENVEHADMPGNVRHPSEPEAGALFKKPHPKAPLETVSVHTYGLKQVRDYLGVYVPNPRSIKAIKKEVKSGSLQKHQGEKMEPITLEMCARIGQDKCMKLMYELTERVKNGTTDRKSCDRSSKSDVVRGSDYTNPDSVDIDVVEKLRLGYSDTEKVPDPG